MPRLEERLYSLEQHIKQMERGNVQEGSFPALSTMTQKIALLQSQVESLHKDLNVSSVKKVPTKKVKQTDKSQKKKSSKDNQNSKLCIFSMCPSGSLHHGPLLYGQIKVAGGSLCTFKKCPKGTSSIGYIGKGKSKGHLCTYDKCPLSSKILASFIHSE